MSKSKNKKWWISILSTIILGIISSAAYDFIKSKPFLSTLISLIKHIWDYIIYGLNIYLKVWWVIIVFAIYKALKLFFKNHTIEKEPKQPDFANYKSDRFKNWLWKWEWEWNHYYKEWEISNLKPFCPKCDIELLNRSNYLRQVMICPRCEKQFTDTYNEIDDSEGVKSIILDNVRKKRYTQHTI